MKLTTNFSLSEFGFEDGEASEQQIRSAWTLCRLVLQPLRDHVGSGIRITSGVRSKQHNAKIGGSKTSQHMFNQDPNSLCYDAAVDINFIDYMEDHAGRLDFFEFCRNELSLGFSQCIWYTGTRHFHIGLVNNRKQGQCLIKTSAGYLTNESRGDIIDADNRLQSQS